MDPVARLVTPQESCRSEVIAKLEELLGRAKAGEVVGIHGIAETNGEYFIFSTRTLSNLQTAGALLDAAVSRLRDN